MVCTFFNSENFEITINNLIAYEPRLVPLFDQFPAGNYEPVVFCSDKDTGLKVKPGTRNTVLALSPGSVRELYLFGGQYLSG